MDSSFDAAVYTGRRARLAQRLREAGGGVAIVPTAPERPRSADSHHPYRHDSYFHYLTGFAEPGAWLALTSDGTSVLFCRAKDAEREIWDGFRLGPQTAPAQLAVDQAFELALLDEKMPTLLAQQSAVWVPFGVHSGLQSRVEGWLEVVRAQAAAGVECPSAQRNLCVPLDEMRLVKDASELTTMRRAARISAGAHARAMRYCAARRRSAAAPPLHEYEIEAELLHEFRRHGAQSPAYPSIVAAGANACVLHYAAGAALLHPGELCLVDAGCELNGYASDITRTWPVSGKFSAAQRELYDIVWAAHQAAIAQTRPGARKLDAHWAAVRVLAQGMLDTRLLRSDEHGSLDDVIASAAYRQFYMHGTGHWLGRDVHDVGEYLSIDEAPIEQPDGLGGTVVKRPSRHLQPGMVVTIEPGLYVRPAEGVPQKFWHTGIRIEDDAVVTDEGCELITRDVPVTADEIEALMRDEPRVI